MRDTIVEFVKWTLIHIVPGMTAEYIWHTGLGQTLPAHAENLPLGANIGPKINTNSQNNTSKNSSVTTEVLMI